VFVFDANGVCEKHLRDFVYSAWSFCERNDSLFVYAVSGRVPRVHTYTASLEPLEVYPTEPPVRPQLTTIFNGMAGRQIACFDRGAYYVYPERSDARLVDANADGVAIVHSPPFFKAPTRDRGSAGDGFSGGEELRMESTLNLGVFELDSDIRMIVFNATRHAPSLIVGANIVGADERSIATYLTKPPVGAANGFLYLFGDNEQLENGEVGNRMIEKYRFIESSLR